MLYGVGYFKKNIVNISEMKLLEVIKSWSIGILLVLLLLWGTTLQAAVPSNWKESGFSINANGMTLRGVLEQFSHTYGVRLSLLSEGDHIVKGRLKADNGVDFLNRLGASHKFRWFVYNDTLYIVPANDTTSARLDVGEDAVQDAKSALIGVGLFDDRFGWGELPDDGIVIVSGPRSYVDLARDILLPKNGTTMHRGRQIMIFRLKYASAMDREINSRGEKENIPGIKTILTNLLFGPRNASTVSGQNNQFDVGSRKRSRLPKNERDDTRESNNNGFSPLFSPPIGNGKNRLLPVSDSEASSNDGNGGYGNKSGGESQPRIEADPALNAIMIYDDISKKDMYQSLIDQLDVKPQQVEIEALIVDIDRSKLSDMGVEWGVRAGAVNTIVNGTTLASSGTDLPLPGATLLISNAARFYARLKAMESNGEARILATPTILTLDNVAAVLDLSQSAYVSLIGERVADMSDITAGTMLRVVPRIINDGGKTRVRLEVDIEDGALNTPDDASSSKENNTISTSVTRSTISTQAIIDAQQTLMIGGYHAESLTKNKQKVPVLGDIPVVGGLFRSETQSNSTRERLFLITPRITSLDGAVVTATPDNVDAKKEGAKQLLPPMPLSPSTALPIPSGTPQLSQNNAAVSSGTDATGPSERTNLIGSGVHLPIRRVKAKCVRPSRFGML